MDYFTLACEKGLLKPPWFNSSMNDPHKENQYYYLLFLFNVPSKGSILKEEKGGRYEYL